MDQNLPPLRNPRGAGRRKPARIPTLTATGEVRNIVTYGTPAEKAFWTYNQRALRRQPHPERDQDMGMDLDLDDEIPEEDYEAFAEPEEEEPVELPPTVLDPTPQQLPLDRFSLRHRTLEEIFCSAGQMTDPEDPVPPEDLVIVKSDGTSDTVTFVDWASEIAKDLRCPIEDLVVIKASHHEDLLSSHEARIRSLEAEMRELKAENQRLRNENQGLKERE